MNSKSYQILLDVCAKFFNYVRVEGWLASNFINDCEDDIISEIVFENYSLRNSVTFNLPSPGLGECLNKKFIIDINLQIDEFPDDLILTFKLKNGIEISKKLKDLRVDRILKYKSLGATSNFKNLIEKSENLLDIGGRDRSKLDRSLQFECDVTVLDINEGNNVDVVGDAHELSTIFANESFDAVMSVCVFEHLAMPWKVIGEINHVLKINGYVFIYTHQTIGLHDSPWDYFRFSEDVWPVFFNQKTGFEIIDFGSDTDQFVIPFIWHPGKKNAEKSAGREASWVIAKKISNIKISYPIKVKDITSVLYPNDDDDGNNSFFCI